MVHYSRFLKIDLPLKQSCFLWGARKTGKSTFLKKSFSDATYYDLLQSDIFLGLAKAPYQLRHEILALEDSSNVVVIDEIQKLPALLDEVHWLIENTHNRFILCGSSARKLKRYGVNMLGGRAWKYHFFPLVYPELPMLNLIQIFNRGTIPAHYDARVPQRSLKAYLEDYLTLEIQAEGLVRNLPSFARFMDAIRFSHGEMVNYSNIAREVGVDSKTVREYFYILVDTLVGYLIYPYKKKVGRQIISEAPKFYFFDVGVSNFLQGQVITELKGPVAGRSLEHYILLELIAYRALCERGFDITYWRTKSGLEVDFVVGQGEIAIEVKIGTQVEMGDLKGLIAFCQEHQPKAAYVTCMVSRARRIEHSGITIDVVPVQTFLERLWSHKVL